MLTAPVYERVSHTTSQEKKRLPNIDPNETAEEWLEQFQLGSNRVHVETCWRKHDDNTPVYIRAIQSHCSRPIAQPRVLQKT